jgi:hypothetical protein
VTAIRSQHTRVFEQLMHAHRETLIAALITGALDHLAYRQLVGRLQGIADALRISEEADYKLSGEEPDVSGA